MIEKFLELLYGYVRLLITGEQAERFLNLCKSRGISFRGLRRTGEMQMTGILAMEDFFKLRPIRSKTGVHIHILEKHGLPFFFYRNKKRKAFFLGGIMCLVLLAVLSGRIWNIHIEGNVKNSTTEILAYLEEQGIDHGISKKAINCSEVAAGVRKKYPEITWVSAKIQGSRLILTIQEGDAKEKEKTENEPCNLTAGVEGKIVKMVTRAGLPLMKTGDTCKKGDILVLGRLEIMNDSQEVVRYAYVPADADVYVEHKLAYYDEFPLKYQAQVSAGETSTGYFVCVGKWYLGKIPKLRKSWKTVTEKFPVRITENFMLPVSFGRITSRQYKTLPAAYTEKEAKAAALRKLHLYEGRLLKKGIEISENDVKTEITKGACISRGTLTIIEKTGMKVPIRKMEQPEKG